MVVLGRDRYAGVKINSKNASVSQTIDWMEEVTIKAVSTVYVKLLTSMQHNVHNGIHTCICHGGRRELSELLRVLRERQWQGGGKELSKLLRGKGEKAIHIPYQVVKDHRLILDLVRRSYMLRV